MPTYRDRGIVLRTRPLKDTDRQYVVYTERHGKVSLIASGMRKSKSKMAPHMATFGIVELMVARGRRVERLAGASLVTPTAAVAGSIAASASAQSFFAAVDGLTRRDQPDERVFALLAEYLSALAESAHRISGRPQLFDAAVMKLFDLIGFGVELNACVRCREPLVPSGNGMNFLRGGVECARCRDANSTSVSESAIKVLRFFRSESLRTSGALGIPDAARREASFIIDLLLTDHLDGRAPLLRYMRALTATR